MTPTDLLSAYVLVAIGAWMLGYGMAVLALHAQRGDRPLEVLRTRRDACDDDVVHAELRVPSTAAAPRPGDRLANLRPAEPQSHARGAFERTGVLG